MISTSGITLAPCPPAVPPPVKCQFEILALKPLSAYLLRPDGETCKILRPIVQTVPVTTVQDARALSLPDRLAAAERELAVLCAQLKALRGPFSREEVSRLPFATLGKLQWTWQAVQLARLAVLGEAEHLFDAAVESHGKRGKFVVANEDSLSFFDDEGDAFDAAAGVTVRLIGPLGCVAHVLAGAPLPLHPVQPASPETADILEQMSQLHEAYGSVSAAFPGEDVQFSRRFKAMYYRSWMYCCTFLMHPD